MTTFFDFEKDFIASLRCIPMIVRYKLDTCGVKLKLDHWHDFNTEEKDNLVTQPCETAEEVTKYHDDLQALIKAKTGQYAKELEVQSNPAWQNKEEIPTSLQEKIQEFEFELTKEQWQKLDDLQRFVLIKLSRPSHENKNFLPALKEFGLQ